MRQDSSMWDKPVINKQVVFVLTTFKDGEDPSNATIKTIHGGEKAVMEYIVQVGNDDKDPRRIAAVRSIDVAGTVREYQIVFKGKLTMEEITP